MATVQCGYWINKVKYVDAGVKEPNDVTHREVWYKNNTQHKKNTGAKRTGMEVNMVSAADGEFM
jgi:hypothetical protein